MNKVCCRAALLIITGWLTIYPGVCSVADASPSYLNFERVLGEKYACSVSFLSESELVALASPSSRCYDSLDALELVAVSLDGKVVARRKWSSTNPGVVLRPDRLVLPEPGGAEVLDARLNTIQTLRMARRGGPPAISATDTGLLSLELNGRMVHYAGTPLREVSPPVAEPVANAATIVSTLDGSWELLYSGSSLIEARPGAKPRSFADLSWVIPPCGDACDLQQRNTQFQTALGKCKRVVVTSRGSSLSVTRAFAVAPYFRVQVFDLDSGAEVYREEDFFRAGERTAMLSPDGDRLVISDGYTAAIHVLP